jgi:PBP1b-binding outer membrane lipoprotein LpoB
MKIKLFTFALALAVVITGCSSDKTEDASPESTEQANATNTAAGVQKEETDKEQEEEKGIEVDKNLLNVTVTLPASLFEGQNIDEVIASAKEDGVKEATKNEDGSVTYKMSKSAHNKMLKELGATIKQSIEEMKTEQTFASIKDITANDSFSQFTLTVDKAAYEGSMDAFAAFGIGLQGMMYQMYEGVDSSKTKVVIDIKDESTGEVFDTVIYPDTLEQE